MLDWSRVTGFDWDEGNARKSSDKHAVTQAEAEQVFLSQALHIAPDSRHSAEESRYHVLGKTEAGRKLHITFTLRADGTLIRVISARDMHRKERKIYDHLQGEKPADAAGRASDVNPHEGGSGAQD
ncbi:MAG: BrnT family toxin [Steroidobacteraceae bacterium]